MSSGSHNHQTLLQQAAELAQSADAPVGDVLERVCRLVRELDEENVSLRKGVFQLDFKPAVCVSGLFGPCHGPVAEAEHARPEESGFLLQEHILRTLADGITVQDTDFNIIYQNDAMRRTFGSHVGEKCYVIYERRTSPCEGCGIHKAFQTGEPTIVLRTAQADDGTTSFWENVCFPIFDERRRVLAGVEVCRDVSARVSLEQEVKDRNIQLGQLNEQLKAQAGRLEEALHLQEQAEEGLLHEMQRRQQMEVQLRHAQKLEAIGQLAAGIAHELNTPTQYVADNLGFLRSCFQDVLEVLDRYRQSLDSATACCAGKAARVITTAESGADLAFLKQNVPAAITDALEGLSRVSAIVSAVKSFGGSGGSQKDQADLNKALQDTLLIAQNEYRNVADIETSFGVIPPVWCRVGDLNQVFLNLLVNAARAIANVVGPSGQRGRIRLKTGHEGDFVRIEIQDTGCGIPQEIQDRVFEPFFTTRDVGEGTGLGLTIAYAIVVDKHQGSLSFRSEPGRGTTFTVLLPVGAPSEPDRV